MTGNRKYMSNVKSVVKNQNTIGIKKHDRKPKKTTDINAWQKTIWFT